MAAAAAIGAAAAAAVRYAARSEFTSTAHCQRGAAHYATNILRQDNKNSHLLYDMCVCVCSDILSVLAAAETLSLSLSHSHIHFNHSSYQELYTRRMRNVRLCNLLN